MQLTCAREIKMAARKICVVFGVKVVFYCEGTWLQKANCYQ